MKYLVIKPFFKVSEQKNYSIDETIELSKEDATPLLSDGYLSEIKETKKGKSTIQDVDND